MKKFEKTEDLLKFIGEFADEYGTEVYVVGGYVRDRILGIEVKDIDFTVINNGVDFAEKLAGRLGVRKVVKFQKFGTCLIPFVDYKLEFVQARSETYEPDSRKPVVTAGDLHTDLERRDFTINTLAQRLTAEGIGDTIDEFNGLADLTENSIIKTPLDPEQTFDDDPLRMIRAIRFVTRFGFSLDDKALEAIKKKKDRIRIVSQERITDEFIKILMTDAPSSGLDILRDTGLLDIIFPELSNLVGIDQRGAFHHKDVWRHTIKVVDNVAEVSDRIDLRLAALYHDIAKPDTKRFIDNVGWTFHGHEVLGARMIGPIIMRLKLPKDYIPYLEKLIRMHLRLISLSDEGVTDSAIRRLMADAGNDIEELLILCKADITSGNPKRVKKHLKNFDYVIKRMGEVKELDEFREFKSPVDGNEIMKTFGIRPSPVIGEIKKFIEEAILDGEIPNEHDAAFEYIQKHIDRFLKNGVDNEIQKK
ncbi:MAG: HD domain-containing protein [bacterium]|nr:HD domain-containing protein [bacterium]